MNLGQLPLVVGAFAILATLQLSMNTSMFNAYFASYEDEAGITAVAIAQAMVDEATGKQFDKQTAIQKVFWTSELTSYGSFGPDSAEYVPANEIDSLGIYRSQLRFNDIDDYHHYTRVVQTPRLGTFNVRDSIIYVQDGNKNLFSSSQTWYKKIIVTVNNSLLSKPVIKKSMIVYRRYF